MRGEILVIRIVIKRTAFIMKDATQNALMAQKLMSYKLMVEQELVHKYDTLREEYQQEQDKIVSLDEARKNKLRYEEETINNGHCTCGCRGHKRTEA